MLIHCGPFRMNTLHERFLMRHRVKDGENPKQGAGGKQAESDGPTKTTPRIIADTKHGVLGFC